MLLFNLDEIARILASYKNLHLVITHFFQYSFNIKFLIVDPNLMFIRLLPNIIRFFPRQIVQ